MERQEIIFVNSIFFVLGFALVFSILGILLQTILSHIALEISGTLRVIGGAVIIIFGILLIASVKYFIPFFTSEYKMKVKKLRSSYLSALVFGIAFAIGWTPCVGAILGSIYTLAATSPGTGFLLLLAYSLGLGIPFLIFGAFTSKIAIFLEKIRGFLKYFNIVSGLFLIGIGILVLTNYIGILALFLVGPQGMMSVSTQLNFLLALVAGVLTFLSPCILPLLPAYFSYMAGTTSEEARK
ncbi:MAG: sulfite exporter TauE/SafE family protein [Candidatus Micrarchaeota archaeon]|nr:sulfite exporter TauE/SafE family protein [Candidatus Micrarchaeota archaeon]MDE1847348.1 sulfite exporter TauE/SafE family protein [Candidatus Micrarchaeota archaeon]MDE1863963.1 sulfite exporter TauE/SafE family protein [Candidatus Micrarchaeota archaeon]